MRVPTFPSDHAYGSALLVAVISQTFRLTVHAVCEFPLCHLEIYVIRFVVNSRSCFGSSGSTCNGVVFTFGAAVSRGMAYFPADVIQRAERTVEEYNYLYLRQLEGQRHLAVEYAATRL